MSVTVPFARAVTWPDVLTCATDGSLTDQLVMCPVSPAQEVEPSFHTSCTLNWSDSPFFVSWPCVSGVFSQLFDATFQPLPT